MTMSHANRTQPHQNWLSRHFLQLSLPFTLFWLAFPFSAGSLDALVAVAPEGSALHAALELSAVPLLLILVTLCAALAYRLAPSFLIPSPSRRLPSQVGHLLLHLLAWLVALAMLFFVLYLVFVRPGEDPNHSQSGLSAIVMTTLYPILLAPVLSVISTWWWMSRLAAKETA